VRRRRWATAAGPAEHAEAGWAELRDTALDLGLAWDDRVTLRRRARDLVRSFGHPAAEPDAFSRAPQRGAAANSEAAQALDRLVKVVEQARYARGASAPTATLAEVQRDTECCVEALRAGSSRRRRTRGTWLPASLWGSVSTVFVRSPSLGAVGAEPGIDRAV
jgi:hypothetical protein